MTKNTLPTYAIVELLIRLSQFNPLVGDYRGHAIYNDGVIVKTTHGSITFTQALIKQQFDDPQVITDAELITVLTLFKPAK